MTSIDEALGYIDGARGEIGTYAEILANRARDAEASLAAVGAILDRYDCQPHAPVVETIAARLERVLRSARRPI